MAAKNPFGKQRNELAARSTKRPRSALSAQAETLAVAANPVPGGARPGVDRIQNDRRTRFNPIHQLTPRRLTMDLQNWDLGYIAYLSLLMDAIERRDENLSTVAPRRYEAPSNLPWDIVIAEGEQENPLAIRQRAMLKYHYNNLRATDALHLDKVGGVSSLLRGMNRSVGHFYAIHERTWQPANPVWQETTDKQGKLQVRLLAGLAAEYRLCPNWWFETITGKLRYLQYNFEAFGGDMLEDDWLVTINQGLLIPSAINYLFQKMSLNDWVIYNRDFGRPLIDAITDAAKGTPAWQEFKDTLQEIFGAGIILHSRSGEVKPTKFGEGMATYKDLLELLEKRILRMWRGGDLKTQSGKSGNVGSQLQQDEASNILKGDARILEETANAKIDLPVLRWYLGPDVVPLVYFKLITPKEKDEAKELATDAQLINWGAQVKLGVLAERYGRTVENGDDAAQPGLVATAKTDPALGEAELANVRRTVGSRQETVDRRPQTASAALVTNTLAQLVPQLRQAHAPLIKRLQIIAALHDPAQQLAELRHLDQDFPELAGKILGSPALAASGETLADAAGAAVINGLAAGAKGQQAVGSRQQTAPTGLSGSKTEAATA